MKWNAESIPCIDFSSIEREASCSFISLSSSCFKIADSFSITVLILDNAPRNQATIN